MSGLINLNLLLQGFLSDYSIFSFLLFFILQPFLLLFLSLGSFLSELLELYFNLFVLLTNSLLKKIVFFLLLSFFFLSLDLIFLLLL
jgi:hypothetical protein